MHVRGLNVTGFLPHSIPFHSSGKARSAYVHMDMDDAHNYNCVKDAILKKNMTLTQRPTGRDYTSKLNLVKLPRSFM